MITIEIQILKIENLMIILDVKNIKNSMVKTCRQFTLDYP